MSKLSPQQIITNAFVAKMKRDKCDNKNPIRWLQAICNSFVYSYARKGCNDQTAILKLSQLQFTALNAKTLLPAIAQFENSDNFLGRVLLEVFEYQVLGIEMLVYCLNKAVSENMAFARDIKNAGLLTQWSRPKIATQELWELHKKSPARIILDAMINPDKNEWQFSDLVQLVGIEKRPLLDVLLRQLVDDGMIIHHTARNTRTLSDYFTITKLGRQFA